MIVTISVKMLSSKWSQAASETSDFIFRLIILGESGVGKTSILQRYKDSENDPNPQSTIGVDFSSKSIRHERGLLKLQIWDSAGQEKYRSLTRTYFRNTIACVLVYDVTDSKSFDAIESWVGELERYSNPNMVKLLIGNKTDLENERVVSFDAGLALARKHKMIFCEVSAKTNQKIEAAFNLIIEGIFKRIDAGAIDLSDTSSGVKRLSLVDVEQPVKTGCCW